MQLDVQFFKCHNPVMRADLRKILKVKEYPRLITRFIAISKYPDATIKHQIIKGIVTIEIAGISKRFEVDSELFTPSLLKCLKFADQLCIFSVVIFDKSGLRINCVKKIYW